MSDNTLMTSAEDRQTLLLFARESIRVALKGRRLSADYAPPGASLPSGTGGAFVTLKLLGTLRGCIGHLHSENPIYRTVADMALSAAFADPRFSPLSTEEFDRITIEISRLSAFFPISPQDVEVGKHGLYLRVGHRSGLLLPQVPEEQGWDRPAFLSGLCHKAGVPAGSWDCPHSLLEAFTAEVFGED